MRFQGQSISGAVVVTAASAVVVRGARVLWVLIALVCLLCPAVALGAPDETVVSSRSTGSGPPDELPAKGASGGSISGDGRYVAFSSNSPNMGPGGTSPPNRPGISCPGCGAGSFPNEVYLRDHVLNTTIAVSTGGIDGASGAIISSDGRHVVFHSRYNALAPGDDPRGPGDSPLQAAVKLYVRDLKQNTVSLLTPSTSGAGGNNRPVIGAGLSADGRYVIFSSDASNLVAGDDSDWDGFIRDRDPDADGIFDEMTDEGKPQTTIVVPGSAGAPGSVDSISADGRYVSFASAASNLVAGDTNSKRDVFVRNTQDGTTTLASRASDGALGNGDSPGTCFSVCLPVTRISGDGRSVAFSSVASNLVDGAGAGGVFVHDLRTHRTTLVAPVAADPSISRDGRFVSFVSAAANLVAGDTNGKADVFVRDLQERATVVASRSSGAGPPVANNDSYASAMSADGRFVTFDSTATNLVEANPFNAAGVLPAVANVFRRELATAPAAPSVSTGDVSVAEGDAGETDAVFRVELSKESGLPVEVAFATANGTAGAGEDYVQQSGVVKFAPGETSKAVTAKVKGDTLQEPDETFFVNLSDPYRATIADGQGVGTIVNDDVAQTPVVSIADTSVSEPDSGEVDATFTLTLSGASGQAVSVAYATAEGGTATAGEDYVPAGGTVSFTEGQTQKTVAVKVKGDLLVEDDETFLVKLSAPQQARVGDGEATGTIVDNDVAGPGPAVSVADAAPVLEGDSGVVQASFAVSLASASSSDVAVDFATAGDTATAGEDFVSKTQRVTIAAGQTSETVTVAVKGDLLDEPDERLLVNLSNAAGATVADGQAIGMIIDDDDPPSAGVSDLSVTEGDSTDVIASFDVSLSAPSGRQVTVAYATADASATAPADYTSRTGSVTFAPGDVIETVMVVVKGDLLDEPDERLLLGLSGPDGATLADGEGTATIIDNDSEPALSISDTTVLEGDVGEVDAVFAVSLSAPSGREVTVDVATADGSASAPADYASKRTSVTFAAGETTKTVSVSVKGDTLDESDESFFVSLFGAGHARPADRRATGTITDDDEPAPTGDGAVAAAGASSAGSAPAGVLPGVQPPGAPAADSTRPLLGALSLSRKRFRAVRSSTTVSYTLSEAALVVFGVERAVTGRRVAGGCVKATRSNASKRRCTRYQTLRGSLREQGQRGANRFVFRGRLAGRALPRGRYRLVAVATDGAGNESLVRRSAFSIVRR